jgi:hypothetical protein
MCELCGTKEERKKHIESLMYFSEQLERMASFVHLVARGTIKPHTPEMKKNDALAHEIIRRLVNDWM